MTWLEIPPYKPRLHANPRRATGILPVPRHGQEGHGTTLIAPPRKARPYASNRAAKPWLPSSPTPVRRWSRPELKNVSFL